MINVTVAEDCGNAPKKQIIRDFLIACANTDIESAAGMVEDGIALTIPGQVSLAGKDVVKEQLRTDASREKVAELVIDNTLSHGDRGAANGTLVFESGDKIAFASFYVFTSHSKDAKLKEITAYSIALPIGL